jgi:hypothetical protein
MSHRTAESAAGVATADRLGNKNVHNTADNAALGDHAEETAPTRVHLKLRPVAALALHNDHDLTREVQHRVGHTLVLSLL